MTKPVTGQYECVHRSGVGLDYFTSRVDRLTLQASGRFVLAVQDRSRIANAAQSLVSGQQANMVAPEIRREGNYTCQGNVLFLHFDDGKQEQGQFSWNGEGVQIGTSFFNKVSDSTLLPPTHRIKKDMEDIAHRIGLFKPRLLFRLCNLHPPFSRHPLLLSRVGRLSSVTSVVRLRVRGNVSAMSAVHVFLSSS